MAKILFDQMLETTPESLLPIIENLASDLMDRNTFFVGEIKVRPVSIMRRRVIDLANGMKTEIKEPIKSSRPENIGVVFFDTLIGVFDVVQTNPFPCVSHVTGKLLVSPENFKLGDGLGGYNRSKEVLEFLIDGIQNEIKPYFKDNHPLGEKVGFFQSTIIEESKRTAMPKGSDHYAWSNPEDRRKIVKEYREAKRAGNVVNKETWAGLHANITGKTLKNYEKEFPEET